MSDKSIFYFGKPTVSLGYQPSPGIKVDAAVIKNLGIIKSSIDVDSAGVHSLCYLGDGMVLATLSMSVTNYARLYRSADYGVTWSLLRDAGVNDGKWDYQAQGYPFLTHAGNGKLYMHAYGSDRVGHSHDYGVTWAFTTGDYFVSTALAYLSNTVLLIGTATAIQRSTNDVDHVEVYSSAHSISAIEYFGNSIAVASGEKHIYRSSDSGVTFSDLGEIASGTINCLVILDDNHALAGTSNGYIYRSSDRGATWTQIVQATTKSLGIKKLFNLGAGAILGFTNDASDGSIILSKDWGNTWSEVNTGINPGFSAGIVCDKGIVLASAGTATNAIYSFTIV